MFCDHQSPLPRRARLTSTARLCGLFQRLQPLLSDSPSLLFPSIAVMSSAVSVDPYRGAKLLARDIFGGTLAGIAVTFVGHPFDTLKVRLQTQPNMHPPLYSGLVDCFRKTLKWEGASGLYRGVTSPLAGQMLFRANMFLSFGEAKRWLRGARPENTLAEFYLAGSMGWTMGTLIECPIDLAKSQMQVQIIREKSDPSYRNPYRSTWHAAQTIVRTNGFFGLFQGFTPHLCRNIPGGALHLGTFEALRSYFAKTLAIPKAQLRVEHNLAAGGMGGLLFWSVCFPIDVIKSAFQTDEIHREKRVNTSINGTVRRLYAEGGWRRFYRGFSPCLLRSVPANAIMCWVQQIVTDSFPM